MTNRTKIVIIILVALNLVLMTFLYIGKPNKHKSNSPREVIIEKLGFDEAQQKQFKSLILEHQVSVKTIMDEIRKNKTILYQGIEYENQSFNDSIIEIIGDKFEQVEQAHYNHFLGIKTICNESQKEKYNQLLAEFHTLFARPRRNQKH